MPNTSSAKKALRVSRRRRIINLGRKRLLKDAIKTLKRSVMERNKDKSVESLKSLYKIADKIAKTGYIKPNKAARIKSRATKLFNKTFNKGENSKLEQNEPAQEPSETA